MKIVPIWSDPAAIIGRGDGSGRVEIHLHIFALGIGCAPDRVLADSARRAIRYRLRRLHGCWHGGRHPLWRNFLLLAVFVILVAALLPVLIETGTAVVELAFLSPLALDDVFEESVSQDVFGG
jgi:hypothetical protein